MDAQNGGDAERERLLRRYEALPKTEHWIYDSVSRHSDIRPEWIVAVIDDPYEVISELRGLQNVTVLTGRVPQFSQWIKVVLISEGAELSLFTAYADRRLEDRYGGRPWQI